MTTPTGDRPPDGDATAEPGATAKRNSMELRALDSYFPEIPTQKSPKDLIRISSILKENGYKRWANTEMLYTIFRMLGLLDRLDDIINLGASDNWIPVHPGRFRPVLHLTIKQMSDFRKAQDLVLLPHLPSPDKWPYKQHVACTEQGQSRLIIVRRVSIDDRRTVNIVQDRITGAMATQKLTQRFAFPQIRTCPDRSSLWMHFHRHIMDLIGICTTMDSIIELFAPATDLNLVEFLRGRQRDRASILKVQGWIGCLTSAISYLHRNSIWHGNIKATGIMIDRENIVLSDLSLSVDANIEPQMYWSPSQCGLLWTNQFADIWDLGHVWVQMLSFVCGQHPQSVQIPASPLLRRTSNSNIRADDPTVEELLSKICTSSTQPIIGVIKRILTSTIANQSTAHQVAADIQQIVSKEPKWCHQCCSGNLFGDRSKPEVRNIASSQDPLTDQEIELFRRELGHFRWRDLDPQWVLCPRLYIILELMKRTDLISAFERAGVSDVWIPLDEQLLRHLLDDPSERQDFLKHQITVLNQEMEPMKHQHFLDGDGHLSEVKTLGSGGFGVVSHCQDLRNERDVAKKLIPRYRVVRDNRAKEATDMFKEELDILRLVTSEEYHHFVSMVGSYTDVYYFALLFSPVADTSLEKYLKSSPNGTYLKRWFGCLASAVKKLHDMRIRHKDIKPSNCLVLGDNILLSDFGLSRDWNAESGPTTRGWGLRDPHYCAPEVYDQMERNQSADIWSLGCVYLEMYSVLEGKTVGDVRQYFSTRGTRSRTYHRNGAAVLSWLNRCDNREAAIEGLSSLLKRMLSTNRHDRITAEELVQALEKLSRDVDDLDSMFCNRCVSEMRKQVKSTQKSGWETWEDWDQFYSEMATI